MSFTDQLVQENAALCADLRAMPFNRTLADGTLPQAAFRHYILQDAHYLEGFARSLALAAACCTEPSSAASHAVTAAPR